ncbi:hypothetical protein ACQEVB_11790 [Pseudonocardia sp. CA-107938]|uniref:hypothetical protein n=1 Tax=Pseudonocardia sp. CA-107938 TaxID=3240021 RepID=UPI003D8DA696
MSAPRPADHLLRAEHVAFLREHLQRAEAARLADRREPMIAELIVVAGYLQAELDTAPQDPRAAALAEVDRLCRAMNRGAPGWHLRDQILAVLKAVDV